MPLTPAFSATAYRDFWQWYLDEAVPRAWQAGGDDRIGESTRHMMSVHDETLRKLAK